MNAADAMMKKAAEVVMMRKAAADAADAIPLLRLRERMLAANAPFITEEPSMTEASSIPPMTAGSRWNSCAAPV